MKRLICLIGVWLAWSVPAYASIAVNVNTDTGATNSGSGTTVSWSFDPVGGGCSSCALLVQVIGSNVVDDVTGATFNGVAMTLLDKSGVGWRYNYTFGLLSPASGSHTIQVTASTSHLIAGIAISYSGVTGFGATSNANTFGSSITGNITTTAANSWVYLGGVSDGVSAWTAGTNATYRNTFATLSSPAIFDNNTAISMGAYSMTVNTGANGDIGIVMVELYSGAATTKKGLTLTGVGDE